MFNVENQLELLEKLEFTEQQCQLLSKVRLLGRGSIGAAALQTDREAAYPYTSINVLKEAGLIGLSIPISYGGIGAGYEGDVLLLPLILMELASWCSSTSQVFALHNTGVQFVNAMGSAEQKDFFFKDVLGGNLFGSFGSESNPSKLQLTSSIRRNDQGYVLNGRKVFATGSLGAKWAFWRSVSEDKEGTQDERMMMPIVRLSAAGVTIFDDWDGMGQRGTGSGTVTAEQVQLTDLQIMGENFINEHSGFFATQFHIHFAAQFVGIAAGAYRQALIYLSEKAQKRLLYSQAAEEDPIILLRIGDMAAKIAAARQLVIRAARLLQQYQGNPDLQATIRAAASHAKIIATETSLDVTSAIFQIMGASSATRQNGFDMYYRNARTLTLHDPVDKQREAVGRYEIG